MRLTNKLPEGNVNLSKASPIGNFCKSLIGGFVALAIIYFGMVWTINLLVPYVSPEMETMISKVFFRHRYDGGDRTEDEKTIQAMVDGLASTAPDLPYTPVVHIVDDDAANAFALPGGDILILTGLLNDIDSENELAFVLSHEMGHLAHRDHLRGLGRQLTLTTLNLLCDYVVDVELLPDALLVCDRGVSRSQESAADRYGLDRLYQRYGYVSGSLVFFERQKKRHAVPSWAAYFSTHPKDDTRIDDLRKRAELMQYPMDLPPSGG